MKKTIISFFLILFLSTRVKAFDIELNIDIEIPDVCRYLPPKALPVNLSAACLSAQIAAQSFPPLLPAANQLCMILEGITAKVEVYQITINTAYDICDSALAKIETQIASGLNRFHLDETSLTSLFDRLNKISSAEDLEFQSLGLTGDYLGENTNNWDDINQNQREPEKSYTKQNFFKKVAGSQHLGKSIFKNNKPTQITTALVDQISNTTALKQSQDLSARIAGELAFQQNVFNQLLSEYLELESAESLKKIAQERWYQNLLRKREN